MTSCFDEKLIKINLQVSDSTEVINCLAKALFENGYVKDTYCPAVIEREKKYATGLPLEPIGVALPHTEAEHVIKTGVAVGTLQKPIKFGVMGGENEFIDVDLVFLMALSNSNEQITMLQSLADLVGNNEVVEKIRQSSQASEILDLINAEIQLKND